jgi:hypothetical protein
MAWGNGHGDERESDQGPEARGVLSGKTLIPLSLVITLLVQTIGAYVWLEKRFAEIDRRLYEITYQQRDRWTGTDQREWAGALALRNRTLEVPPVRHGGERE